MKTIEIEEEVFRTLETKVRGFGDTPNDVIKRLLAEPQIAEKKGERQSATTNGMQNPIVELVQSKSYQWADAKERYFAVLDFLYGANRAKFEHFNGFRLGSRVQISRSKEEIENSGKSTYPQSLKETGYWVMSNLSNDRKRAILEIILRDFGYSTDVITAVLKSIPDSKITRTSRIILES